MKKTRHPHLLIGLIAASFLVAGCENPPQGLAFLQPKDSTEGGATASTSTRLVERDVEAPDVFQVTEAGLWDGRPSLGGVWVAHPDVGEPERVIIRNTANGKFVIGALFRREREIPGPRLQTSSDAAAALGMLAGAPVQLNVTALRRESVPDEVPAEPATEAATIAAADGISQQTLDPIAAAGAALDEDAVAAESTAASTGATPPGTAVAAATPAPSTAPAAAPAPRASSLDKPFIQIGIFSVEANANRTADTIRSAGMIPTVYEQSSNGKAFWRVVVGPAQTGSERSQLLRKVKEVGFSDAYAVTN